MATSLCLRRMRGDKGNEGFYGTEINIVSSKASVRVYLPEHSKLLWMKLACSKG